MASEKTHGKSKVEEAHYELPDAQTLQEAGELLIKVSNAEYCFAVLQLDDVVY